MTVAVVPQAIDKLGDNTLFEFEEYDPLKPYGTDRIAFNRLRNTFEDSGEKVGTIDTLHTEEIDTCIFIDINYEYLHQLISQNDTPILIYIMREPPSVISENNNSEIIKLASVFDHIFTWNPDLAGLSNFTEYNIPQYMGSPSHTPINFDDQTLIANISSRKYSDHPEELYSERESIIQYYDKNYPDKFSLYGQYWNKPPSMANIYFDQKFDYNEYDIYCGLADSKSKVYRRHKFALCFENMTGINGYMTEKIFDCFRGGTVPIYWGADNITEYIPSNTFIDYRKYGSPEQLHRKICSLDRKEYNEYINAGQEFLRKEPNKLKPSAYANTIHKTVSKIASRKTSQISPSMKNKINTKGKKRKFVRDSKDMAFGTYLAQLINTTSNMPTLKSKLTAAVESLAHRY